MKIKIPMVQYKLILLYQTFFVALKRFLRNTLRGYYLPALFYPNVPIGLNEKDVAQLKVVSTSKKKADLVILLYNYHNDIQIREWIPLIPDGFEITIDRSRYDQADAVLFHLPTLGYIGHLRKRPGQIWVAWTMECKAHFPHWRNPNFKEKFDLMMSYHQSSDIYLPYLHPTYHTRFKDAPKPKKEGHLVAFFASNYNERSNRTRYVYELLKYLDVHCYGKCFRNRALKGEEDNVQGKLGTLSTYKFDLAFENAVDVDYVTEKFYHPLMVGCVPVYLGAPNIDEYAPGDHCFINTADFQSPKDLAEYLLWLDANDDAYQAFFDWKELPLRPTIMDVNSNEHPFVQLCQKITDMRQNRGVNSRQL
jgi:hypothetical protein